MFRPIRRKVNEIPPEMGRELLKIERRGVLALNGENGYPHAVPVNFWYDSEKDRIYFHGAREGYKVDILRNDDKACFTVYGNQFYKEGQWAPYIQSTVIYGKCHLVCDQNLAESSLTMLARKYYPDEETVQRVVRGALDHVQMFELTIDHLSAKQIQER